MFTQQPKHELLIIINLYDGQIDLLFLYMYISYFVLWIYRGSVCVSCPSSFPFPFSEIIMGQTVSHRSSKSKLGSTVFGYTTSTKVSAPAVYITPADQDNVLFKPFLYGLQSTGSSHSVDSAAESQGRTDSGFLLSGKESQLWKDLMYVDQTYYPDGQQKSAHESEIEELLLIGDTLTFKDVSCMSQNNMQDIDLTRRGFGFISPNIGLLSMMQKLDL